MRKGTVVNIKGYRFFEFIAKNNVLIILVSVFIIGIAFGTFGTEKIKILSDYSDGFLERYITERTNSSFFTIMLSSFASSMMILLLIFVSGASMLGVILVPVIAALRGAIYGSVSALLYSSYSLRGIAFNAVIIIPSAVFFIVSLLLASRESVKFSLIIAKITFPKTLPANLYGDFRNYCGRYLFICLFVLFSSIIDAAISGSFINYFKF